MSFDAMEVVQTFALVAFLSFFCLGYAAGLVLLFIAFL